MKKILLTTLVLAFVLVSISGCANGTEQAPPDDGPQQFRIAMSLPTIDNDWQARLREIVDAEIAQQPDNFEFVVINAIDDGDQLNQLEVFLNDDFDAIIILPNNGTLMTPISEQIYNSGIPTIILDRAIDSDNFTSFISGDNVGGGANAAKFIGEFLDGEGDIVVLRSFAGTPIDMDRNSSFMEGIAEFPGINILVEGDGQFNRQAGFQAMQNMLQAHAHIDGVFAQDDEAALGALSAIEQAGRTDIQIITGFGGARAVFERYAANDPDDILRATMTYFPTMGLEGIRYAVALLQGESIPRYIIIDSVVVTSENVHEFMQYSY